MKEAEKGAFIVVGTALLVILLSLFLFISKKENPDEFIEKIDSLDYQTDSIYVVRDSILEKIDTIYIKLENNNKQYEKSVNRIINNDANENYKFFLEYINSNRARLDSCVNR